MSKLSENIKTLRIMAGLSQKELAEKINRSQNTVCNWERAKISPDADILEVLCGLFEVTPNQLFGWDKCPKIDKYIIKKQEIEFEIEALNNQQDEIEKRKAEAAKRLMAYAQEFAKASKKKN